MNLVWLRNDLRLQDNPALYHASRRGPVCCVYAVTPKQWQAHADAPAKLAFWRARLIALEQELTSKNIALKLVMANTYHNSIEQLVALAIDIAAETLSFNNEYPLHEKNRDDDIEKRCQQNAIAVYRYDGDIVMPPGTVSTQQNKMYHVFTPFSRQWHKVVTEEHLNGVPAPRKQQPTEIESDNIATTWTEEDKDFREDLWPVTTNKINTRLERFCVQRAHAYKEQRDIPSVNGTSTISPYLACGAISVRQCITSLRQHSEDWRNNQWATELIWREFYRHLTASYPHISRSENFLRFPNSIQWQNNKTLFEAWCEGKTGFPIVDAAMKQLVQTGWMHNRLRMITAAFLTKLLLIDWRWGEQFFMAHLLDGDYASNNGGWQWSASTGADAAPYFRVFNPYRQSERFDPEGIFIKRFLPELESLNKKEIHQPSSETCTDNHYPEPIIDYKFARQRAIDVFAAAIGKK